MNLEKVKKSLTVLVTFLATAVLAANTHVLPIVVPDKVVAWVSGIGLLISLFAKSLFGWVILPTVSTTNEPGAVKTPFPGGTPKVGP